MLHRVPAPALALLLAAAGTPAQTPTPLMSVEVANQLFDVTVLAAPPGDESRMFVGRKVGSIHLIKDGVTLPTPFLDVSAKVESAFLERGFLGLTFHPNYASNGYFYVNYTRKPDGWTVVERYTRSSTNPDVADPASAFTILIQQQPQQNHNGGCIQFGPDGYLYISFGESNLQCVAMSGNTFLGKILRIDVDGGTPYAVPPSNPFVGTPGVLDEIWLSGFRNPWRFSFDRATGDLYIADVGLLSWEEVSVQPASAPAGRNYGWPVFEGSACQGTKPCGNCSQAFLIKPNFEYANGGAGGLTCIIGGFVYRGCAIPDLRGTYFCGDWGIGRIFSWQLSGTTFTAFQDRSFELAVPSALKLTTFGEDARGEIYYAGRTGRVFKIVPAVPPPATSLGYAKAGGNGLLPNLDLCGLLNTGNSAELRLTNAAPNAVAVLWIGLAANPFPFRGGTLVPLPTVAELPFSTDAQGQFQITVPGGGGPIDLYLQDVILDAGASNGFALSNALKMTVQP